MIYAAQHDPLTNTRLVGDRPGDEAQLRHARGDPVLLLGQSVGQIMLRVDLHSEN